MNKIKRDNKILVVITARGGSKGVPRKNIRNINGHPLIYYSIKAALDLGDMLYKVIVSTDDNEIASVAKECGAIVPFIRPKELASDTAASLPVVQHAVRTIEEQDGVIIDWSILLQPTNPLITANDIKNTIDLMDENVTSVVSVVDALDSHPIKSLKIENGYLKPYIKDAPQAIRRQDLSPVFKRNGAIYATQRDTLIHKNCLYGHHVKPCIMDSKSAIDIDTEFDLKLAEFILRQE